MDFTQRKIVVSDNINDKAKRMKDSVEPFPDCPAKSEMMTLIENTRKDLLKKLDDITTL
jgi:hypothetical protein